MLIIEKMNSFVDTMLSEQTIFENMQSEVSRREQDVSSILDKLEDNEKEVISSLCSNIAASGDEDMQKIYDDTSSAIFEALSSTSKTIKEAVKGMTFIQDFEKRFTVAVFGKVKAGKSYLGNFVIGYPLRIADIPSSYDKIKDLKVNVYDRGVLLDSPNTDSEKGKKELNGSHFYVDKSEATSTIQWANIGGLCWFDTPGIGSITFENEELAKEYVKNADLVIFASNSDAAGTRQEFEEIQQLNDMDKPILLLLTQSDTYDLDIDENGDEISILVPKSETDRKDQEDYMLSTLREQRMENVLRYADIMTVSALLATMALENNDDTMFEQSNLGLFLDKLIDITKNEAADIKRNTPKTRINEMIDSISKDLNSVIQAIASTCSEIAEHRQVLLEKKDWMLEQIKSKTYIEIISIVSTAKQEVENGAGTISGETLSQKIEPVIQKIISDVCESINTSFNQTSLNISLSGISDMKMKQDKIPYEYTVVHSIPRAPHGLREKIGKKFFRKEYYTSESTTETRYSTFDIGVNDSEIAQSIVLQLSGFYADTLDKYIEHLTQGYYKPIELLEKNTIEAINRTIRQLEAMRM